MSSTETMEKGAECLLGGVLATTEAYVKGVGETKAQFEGLIACKAETAVSFGKHSEQLREATQGSVRSTHMGVEDIRRSVADYSDAVKTRRAEVLTGLASKYDAEIVLVPIANAIQREMAVSTDQSKILAVSAQREDEAVNHAHALHANDAGCRALSCGQFALATSHFDEAYLRCPSQEAAINLAISNILLGRTAVAIAWIDKAAEYGGKRTAYVETLRVIAAVYSENLHANSGPSTGQSETKEALVAAAMQMVQGSTADALQMLLK